MSDVQNPFDIRELTVDEYLDLIQQGEFADRRVELVHGRLVEKGVPPEMVSNKRNTLLAMEIGRLIGNAVVPTGLGRVAGADGGFRLADNVMRQPDVGYIRADRLADWDGVLFDGAPDIAVEVISPSDRPTNVLEKTKEYLQAGATIVWNVYPDDASVHEYRLNDRARLEVVVFTFDDVLTAPDLIPDLSISLTLLFQG